MIIDIVKKQNNFIDFIVSNKSMLFISKFLLYLYYYFLDIKQKIFVIFYLQINC